MKVTAYIWSLVLITGLFFLSCERDDEEKNGATRYAIDKSKVYEDDAYETKLKDSVWYYFKIFSLWETAISPSVSDIHKMDSIDYLKKNYTQYFQTPGDIIGYLKYLTKVKVVGNSVKSNEGSGNHFSFYEDIIYTHKKGESKAYDWYSFLDRGGFISGAIQHGSLTGLGLEVMYLQSTANAGNSELYIRFVEKNSSAYEAGLRRGDQILSLNGDTKIDYNTQQQNNFNTLHNYLNSSKLTVAYKSSKGITKTVSIEYKNNSYADPIYVDTVLQAGTKKVAYIGISSFLSTNAWVNDKGQLKSFGSRLLEVADKMVSQNVGDMVVDLRYNGGGSVYTAEYIADLLVPNVASGQLMYTNKINAILKGMGWDKPGEDFGPVNFSKKGNLNLSSVYFLVTNETASASEMLINVLAPYMKVYLVGTYASENGAVVANNTYGKPAGFFPWDIISSNNQLYVASFQMFNKDGYGDYFDGLKPNTHVWEFQSFKDFGQSDESMLAQALEHIKTGVFKSTQARSVVGKANVEQKITRDDFGARKIHGMYKFPTKKIHLN